METKPPCELSWQQTAWAEQPLLPTPITVMGLQVTPSRTSTPWTTIPRRPRSREPAAEPAVSVLLQHWRAPVEHELTGTVVVVPGAVTVTVVVTAGVVVGVFQGVAAARIVRADKR
jgi:hypothetical protein